MQKKNLFWPKFAVDNNVAVTSYYNTIFQINPLLPVGFMPFPWISKQFPNNMDVVLLVVAVDH